MNGLQREASAIQHEPLRPADDVVNRFRATLIRLARAAENRVPPSWATSRLHRRAGIRRLRAQIAACLKAAELFERARRAHDCDCERSVA